MRELLFKVTKADFDETHIRGSGNGGQHRNKTSSGVRLVHRASGAVGEATDSRDQPLNRVRAFQRLRETPEWKSWFRDQVYRSQGRRSLAEEVEIAMARENIRVQCLDASGRWIDIV